MKIVLPRALPMARLGAAATVTALMPVATSGSEVAVASRERCFLNFNENYRENLTAVIETKDIPQFATLKGDAKALSAEIEKTYKTHTITVTGMVKEWINPKDQKGRPQLLVAKATDVKVVK